MNGGNTKRDRLIESAAELFHRKGVAATSLADIAKHAEIPIGNVYYYFKTKDELAMATLEKRAQAFREIFRLLEENSDDPRTRLIHLVRYYDHVKELYMQFGCPVYRMITEGVDADGQKVAQQATQIYSELVEWAEKQFHLLGHADTANSYGLSLLAGIQGGTAAAKAFASTQPLTNEIERLCEWLSSLPNKKIHLGKLGAKAAFIPTAA